jgi:hypothetical protein
MPDIRTRLGRYCAIHKYIHEDEYQSTTMDFQSVFIVPAMSVTMHCLVHSGYMKLTHKPKHMKL